MKITFLTQFPEMFTPVISGSMLGRAAEKGLAAFDVVNIRDFTLDKHKRTDDTPFGGGEGMVMTPQPAFDALKAVGAENTRNIYMSPRGKMLCKDMAIELSGEEHIVILCGHYEGVDQRIIDAFHMEEVSIGDYVLTGGELPAMVLADTVTRLIPGVLSTMEGAMGESVYSGLLEYNQYTKPREFEGYCVPEILYSGDHEKIHLCQFEESLRLTKARRPDMFEAYQKSEKELTKKEKKILDLVVKDL